MHFFRVATLWLNFLLVCGLGTAQTPQDYSVTIYNSDNGLPQTSVGQTAMDKNGFLWLATQGGLVRFDGTQFVTYNRLNVPALTSNRILKVGLRSDSVVYFADENANLYSFDVHNNVVRLPFNDYNKAIVIQSPTRHFDVVESLEKADRERVKSVIPPEQTLIFYHPITKNEGYLWVHANWLFYISNKKIKTSIDVRENVKGRLMSNFGLFQDTLYCMDSESRLNKVDKDGARSVVSLKILDNGHWREEPTVGLQLFPATDRMLLLRNGRLYDAVASGETDLFCKPWLALNGLNDINSYRYIPEKGIHVIGSTINGLVIVKPKQFRTVTLPGSNNIFYAQETFGKTSVFTTAGAVSEFGSPQTVPVEMLRQTGILREPDNNYWVSTKHSEIAHLDAQLNVIGRIKLHRAARIFRRTPDGRIWISTLDKRFGRLSGDSIVWSKLHVESPRLNFLPVGNHTFWMSDGLGLFHYNESSGKKTVVKGMSGKEVREFYFDKQKTLWLGTYGDGFFALRKGKLTRLPADRNGHLLFVHSFLEDNRGFMWITTNHGLFKCKVQDLYDYLDGKIGSVYYYYYDKSNGFKTNEFNGGYPPSGIVLPNGKFSFPSMEGLVQFHPDSIRDILPASEIFIDKVFVDGKEVSVNETFEFKPSVEHIEIKVVSPYFGLAENQSLEYTIQGMGERWYPVNTSGTIVLNRLAYGDYLLKVKKAAGFGSGNMKVLTRKIKVHPFWYQTWVFRISLLALLVVAIYAIVRLRYRYLMRSKQVLETQVRERTKELEHSNMLKAKITALLAHDLQSPIYFLNTLAEYISSAVDRNEYHNLSRGAYEIRNAAGKMHAFVKEINLWSKSQQDGFYITRTTFLFDELISELKSFFDDLLKAKGNTLILDSTEPESIYSNRDILKSILRNLIDNANKHTQNGHITVKLSKECDGTFSLVVSDNGSGMSIHELTSLRNRIENKDAALGIDAGARLGFQIIIDFANLLQCGLSLDSTQGVGTFVQITGLQASPASYHSFSVEQRNGEPDHTY
jgi:signal transduction histidine kinase